MPATVITLRLLLLETDFEATTASLPSRMCAWASWAPQAKAAVATRVRMEAFIEISPSAPDRGLRSTERRKSSGGKEPTGGRQTVGKCLRWYGRSVRYGILGALTVWDDDHELALGGPRQRALLAVLLLRAN